MQLLILLTTLSHEFENLFAFRAIRKHMDGFCRVDFSSVAVHSHIIGFDGDAVCDSCGNEARSMTQTVLGYI